jgi:hypothetical protein
MSYNQAEVGRLIAHKVAAAKRVAAAEELLASPYKASDAEIVAAAKLVTREVPASLRGKKIAKTIAVAKAKRDKVARIKAEARRQAIRRNAVNKWVEQRKAQAVAERIANAVAAKIVAGV